MDRRGHDSDDDPEASYGRQPLFLLPAAGRGPAMWRAQVEALSADFDVVTPSLGETDPEIDFSPQEAAGRIAAAIAEQPAGRALVCGISLGAFVALQLAIDHPERVGALVLSGGQANPSNITLKVNSALLRLMPARAVVRDGGTRDALLASLRSLLEWDVRHLLHTVTTPTLVLCGGQDHSNLPAARALAAAIPGARLTIVPRAGHLWNLSHPKGFNAVVGDYLRAM